MSHILKYNKMWKSEDEMMKSNIFIMYDHREKDSDFGYFRTTASFLHRMHPQIGFHYTHMRQNGYAEYYTFRITSHKDPYGIQFHTFDAFAKHVESWLMHINLNF